MPKFNEFAKHLGMKIGYARVSTKDQNLDLQIQQLQQEGCEKIFSDIVGGAKTDRPELDRLLQQVRAGDVIVIWKLDRLGRSLKHLIELVNELVDRNVGLKSLSDPIDTTNSQGRLVFNIFAALAEFERDLIVERTQAGLKAARARGRTGGRPKGLSDTAQRKAVAAAALYKEAKINVNEIAKNLGITKATLYNYLRHEGVKVGTYRKKKEPKTMEVSLSLDVYNNNKFVRGKKKSTESIEHFVLAQYNMRKPRKNDTEYILTIPYQNEKELDETIDEIIDEAADIADSRHCFIEFYAEALDGSEKVWD